MKLSISNIAWQEKYDEEMYDYLYQTGFQGLEIAPTRLFGETPYENLALARNVTKNIKESYRLEISSLQSILFGKTENLFGSEEERATLFNYLQMAIDFASTIDCHNLVFGSPKNRVLQNAEDLHLAASFFKKLGDYASQQQTILAIEANPQIYGTNFITTTKQAIDLVEKVNSPGFMINLDLGAIIHTEEDIEEILKKNALINHIHISEPHLNVIKKRKIHEQLAEKLKIINYQKFISIEMKDGENIDEVKSTISYVKGVFGDN